MFRNKIRLFFYCHLFIILSAINATTTKPELIMFYNVHKGAIDEFDKKCHHFSTARRTCRWPLRFFYNMLNQAGSKRLYFIQLYS